MGFLSNSGESLKIDSSIEEKILNSSKVNKVIQLGDLKDFFDESEFESKQKSTRSSYRKSITKFLKSEVIAKKLESGTITLKELNENLDKIDTFGNLKKISIFGVKDKGNKRNATYLFIVANKQ